MPEEDVIVEETPEEKETPAESSPEKPEQTVPYERFKEVNDALKTVKEEIESLKNQKNETGLSEEQKKELEAKQYLKKILTETLEEREKETKSKQEQELKEFKGQVDDVLDLNPDVKRSDFEKFLEDEGDDFSSVKSAMKQFRKVNNLSKEVAEKTKKEIEAKPGLPSHEGGEGKKTYPDDQNKSLRQIAEEIGRDLDKKK